MNWFAGGQRYAYKTLEHCLDSDWTVIGLLVMADVLIWVGYVQIALKWRNGEKQMRSTTATRSLRELRWIFTLCGTTYLWTPIDLVWPGWRLLVAFKLLLLFVTWKFVLNSQGLGSMYDQLRHAGDYEELVRKQTLEIGELQRLIVQLRQELTDGTKG